MFRVVYRTFCYTHTIGRNRSYVPYFCYQYSFFHIFFVVLVRYPIGVVCYFLFARIDGIHPSLTGVLKGFPMDESFRIESGAIQFRLVLITFAPFSFE